jgi:hypothetical protein
MRRRLILKRKVLLGRVAEAKWAVEPTTMNGTRPETSIGAGRYGRKATFCRLAHVAVAERKRASQEPAREPQRVCATWPFDQARPTAARASKLRRAASLALLRLILCDRLGRAFIHSRLRSSSAFLLHSNGDMPNEHESF